MTHHTITDSDGDNLSPDEATWNIALARGDIAATLGKALAHLEDATARVERIRALGDTEYTTGLDGLDAQHWIADARRAAQAALTITQTIAGVEITDHLSHHPGTITGMFGIVSDLGSPMQ